MYVQTDNLRVKSSTITPRNIYSAAIYISVSYFSSVSQITPQASTEHIIDGYTTSILEDL